MSVLRSLLNPVRVRGFASCTRVYQAEVSELSSLKQYKNTISSLLRGSEQLTSPNLVALHARLNLPKEFSYSLLSKCLTCRTAGEKNFDNVSMNIFGKNLLTLTVTSELMKQYPRLPAAVLNAAVDAYINDSVLSHVGRSWGIEVENTSLVDRYAKNENANVTLGKLRFFENSRNELHNFTEANAMAVAVRSIVAGVYSVDSDLNRTRKFISDYILSRKLDVKKLFAFEQPTRELAALCRREGLERPVSKLIAENGRLSKSPLFIVGVFSGEEKLGEGFGSSLKEAKARAATDALLKWYCYQPVESQQQVIIDQGEGLV